MIKWDEERKILNRRIRDIRIKRKSLTELIILIVLLFGTIGSGMAVQYYQYNYEKKE